MTPLAFADSTALIDRYSGSGTYVSSPSIRLIVSQFARVEIVVALHKKAALGEMSDADRTMLIFEFERDFFGRAEEWRNLIVVRLHDEHVWERAVDLTGAHGLGSIAALQLATAIVTRSVTHKIDLFLTSDPALATAARAEGFTLPS